MVCVSLFVLGFWCCKHTFCHYYSALLWVVGIDGCAPMNMTMVKNDMKNKERERFSGNFQIILFMTKRHFFMTSSFDHLKIFVEKQAAHI